MVQPPLTGDEGEDHEQSASAELVCRVPDETLFQLQQIYEPLEANATRSRRTGHKNASQNASVLPPKTPAKVCAIQQCLNVGRDCVDWMIFMTYTRCMPRRSARGVHKRREHGILQYSSSGSEIIHGLKLRSDVRTLISLFVKHVEFLTNLEGSTYLVSSRIK